ncbi:iron chelate uptake ABC transporter family permease subunit [Klebsiella variicola]|uniref:iron chelate uptake ABC transporter family permease subunit n=1 Tax=Klebsiella variicola TaxID=244366 RepID=UPI0028162AE3|nr:iron chelate uptake ABC transporter family permease subunit [Klebsiella variicola]
MIPHLVRALIGNNHGKLIPVTALCGALFLLVIDTLARAHLCGNTRRYSVRPDRGTVICIFVCQRSHP